MLQKAELAIFKLRQKTAYTWEQKDLIQHRVIKTVDPHADTKNQYHKEDDNGPKHHQEADHLKGDNKHHHQDADHLKVDNKHHHKDDDHLKVDKKHHHQDADHLKGDNKHHHQDADRLKGDNKHHHQDADHLKVDNKHHQNDDSSAQEDAGFDDSLIKHHQDDEIQDGFYDDVLEVEDEIHDNVEQDFRNKGKLKVSITTQHTERNPFYTASALSKCIDADTGHTLF
jgi:hypothetical protein